MSGIQKKLHLAAAGACAAALIGGCAMFSSAGERYVTPPVGTTYARDIRNTGSFGKSYREESRFLGERSWDGRSYLAHERSTGMTSMIDAEGGWAGEFKGGAPVFTFSPSMGPGYPLKVGATASKDVQMTLHAQKRVVPFRCTWRVEALEDVTVPAGTFRAFRIAYEDTLGTSGTWWIDPSDAIFVKWSSRRSDKHPQGAGTSDAQLVALRLNQ
jgi:hypothetical protein